MKIYLAHPINRLSADEVISYFTTTKAHLDEMGYEVLNPMTAKGYLRTEKTLRAEGYGNPRYTNHVIFERDKWMVSQSDIVFCDLTGRSGFSIGCTMEMAWASLLGKHSVLVLPAESEYRHAFMLEAADIVFETYEQAMDYFKDLSVGNI